MSVGPREPAEIAALADGNAGDEEAHREGLRPGRLGERRQRGEHRERGRCNQLTDGPPCCASECTEAGVPFLFKQWGNWQPQPICCARRARRC